MKINWTLYFGCCVNVTSRLFLTPPTNQAWVTQPGSEQMRVREWKRQWKGSALLHCRSPAKPETTTYSSGLDIRHSTGKVFESCMVMKPVSVWELSWAETAVSSDWLWPWRRPPPPPTWSVGLPDWLSQACLVSVITAYLHSVFALTRSLKGWRLDVTWWVLGRRPPAPTIGQRSQPLRVLHVS